MYMYSTNIWSLCQRFISLSALVMNNVKETKLILFFPKVCVYEKIHYMNKCANKMLHKCIKSTYHE